ncbi:MAG: hypothetical protein HOW73_33935 [Polyangiaceae bacterium]|nr:hypothetical protein [Polyangiaceae bacterium]
MALTDKDVRSLQRRATGACVSRDASVPSQTAFPYSLEFAAGATTLAEGDAITISNVEGTRPAFAVGGMYRVRGHYTLRSAAEATLLLSVTATASNEGCTTGIERASIKVQRGSGEFDLATTIPYEGHPHVSFYANGSNAGGVYFGKDSFLR